MFQGFQASGHFSDSTVSSTMFGFLGSKESLSEEEKKECVVELRKRLEDGSQPVEEQLRAGGEAGLAQGPGLDDAFLHRWLRAEDHRHACQLALAMKHLHCQLLGSLMSSV